MAAAGSGELVTTGAVLDRSCVRFDVQALAPLRLKGKSQPVQAFRVGPVSHEAPVTGTDDLPLLGRENELTVLRQRFDAARVGHGQVVDIVGEAGIGKSRLLAEFLAGVGDARVLEAHGEVYASATPYRSIRSLVRAILELDSDAGPEQLSDAVARMAPALVGWSPLIGTAAGVEIPDSAEMTALEGRFRKARLEDSVAELLVADQCGPVVLLVEDLHLFDDVSADLVRRLTDVAPVQPWLVLVTRRGSRDTPDLAGAHSRIDLPPLDRAASTALLLEATAQQPLAPHVQHSIMIKAAGNPLFLRELVAGFGAATLDELPDSVEGVIAARIDRLDPRDRSLLRAAAVLGMQFSPQVLGEVLGSDAPADIGDSRTITARLGEFLRLDATRQLCFRLQLVRDTAYEGLSYRRRTVLHGRAAETIERAAGARSDEMAEILAVHYAAASHPAGTWHFARVAAARARYALVEAEVAYTRAAEAADQMALDTREVLDVLEALGDVRFDLGASSTASCPGATSPQRGPRWTPGTPVSGTCRDVTTTQWLGHGRR
jgi:predicted ATPase